MIEVTRILVRSELRRRRNAYLGILVVVAVSGAVAMAALAGARRTASAFERHLAASEASAVGINVASYDDATSDALSGLPGVVQARTYAAVLAAPVDPQTGKPLVSTTMFEGVASMDGRFLDQDRAVLVSGRLPHADRADEVLVNRTLARDTGIGVRDALTLQLFDPDTFEPMRRRKVTVTGVGVTSEEVAVADIDDIQRIILTPAFVEQNPDAFSYNEESYTYAWTGLRLRPGTDVDEVESAWEKRAPARFSGESAFRYRRASTLHAGVQRANRPQVAGLAAFGGLASVLALALTVQAVRRVARTTAGDAIALRAVGT